ncbi:MAG TPA: hypothetical protein PLE48_14535 [Thiobacillus sp.]|uniref:hypothetical protein n=1 Tax=Acidovorax sp. TaxID=1872122 RepID=UPI0026312376|nr:hypothetical protein [Acidovorax sp.]HQT19233.1 hypothetical protein [Acidovorax defluvii]HQT71622.1 hypothetical protein [Thiobacillus sp.]
MQKISKVTDDHVIYGDWDDTYENQVLVYYHPNGIHCTVFVLGGTDYGGGIVCMKEGARAHEVYAAWEGADSNYTFHRLMAELCEKQE